jgi:probable rRNA maturation factor
VASRRTGKRTAKSPGRQAATSPVRVSVVSRIPVAKAAVAALVSDVIRAERGNVVALSITFVGEGDIRRLNRKHLGKNRATDVIAFSFGPPLSRDIVGDIYICADVAREQARELGIPVSEEIRRLVIHGVLHVLGHDHPPGDERLRSPMWRRQERHLKAFAR